MTNLVHRWTVENLMDPNFADGEMDEGWPLGGKAVRHGLGDFRRTVVEGALLWHLGRFVVPRRLGVVSPGAGFVTPEGGALVPPDVAYVRAERLPPTPTWDGLCQVVPDLVADVRSVIDDLGWNGYRRRDAELVGAYLEAGVRLVWVIDPRPRTVNVRRPNGTTQTLTADDWLDGEDVLPGFRFPVTALFRPPSPDD